MGPIIECVPNFSEGQDISVITKITDAVQSVAGVKLLHADPGREANRTVVTFAGAPVPVCEAAFRAVKKATELIDMRKHKGIHPRIGGADVCPLIPVSGISMEETAALARHLAERIGKETGIPVYCYEHAAFKENRRNLASCRAGEYEGLEKKLADPEWQPDFGSVVFNSKAAQSGATVVGARNFLAAYNINLNTPSVQIAKDIASVIREKGQMMRNRITGKIKKDRQGKPVYKPGMLKSVKAMGWYVEEYGCSQVSMNLTDLNTTSLHTAHNAVAQEAKKRGIEVTGSELIGLIPLKAMTDAGNYFLQKQHGSSPLSEARIIHAAIKSLGLDSLHPFDPEKRIIEYVLDP